MFQILNRYFTEARILILFLLYLKIIVCWTFFVKIFFKNLKHTFSYATRQALSNHHKKRKNKSSEILNCGHITYSVNTVKIEYLPLGKSRAANILTLLVWR
jgi:hypothetical protein